MPPPIPTPAEYPGPLGPPVAAPAGEGPKPPPAAPSFDGSSAAPFGGAMFGPTLPSVLYRVFWAPDQPVRGQPTDLGLVREDFAVTAPVWQDPANELSFSARLRSEILNENATFPVSGERLPDDLWNIGFGGSYRHNFDNDWTAGAGVLIGSASDKPFHGWDEMNTGLNAFLRVPHGDHDAWLFTLMYSPTAQIPFPIPGVAYAWAPSDQFRMNVGLPFQMTYRPTDDLTFSFSYMLLTTVHAQVAYHCWGPIRVYAGYDWENEAYLPADRPDTKDRLFSYDMRLSGGVQAALGGRWMLDFSSGYLFDRFYAFGNSSALSTQDRIDAGAGPFLGLSCMMRW